MCEEIVWSLRVLGVNWIERVEEFDPQFQAIKCLVGIYDANGLLRLTVLNALISYQPSCTGEELWAEFANYFSTVRDDSCEEFMEYVLKSKCLRRFRKSRLNRVVRACKAVRGLDVLKARDLRSIWNSLSNAGFDRLSKTVLFAVKMAYYTLKALGTFVEVPPEIPIPVDSRILFVTRCSCLNVDLKDIRKVQRLWTQIAHEAGIPPLRLDTVIWLLGGLIKRRNCNLGLVLDDLEKAGLYVSPYVRVLVEVLGYCCLKRR